MNERYCDCQQLYYSGLGPPASCLKLNKVCRKLSGPSNPAPGLSVGGKGANFSPELHGLCYGQKVRGSVYCSVFPSQLYLSDKDQLLSDLLGDC